jgi:hypothetical protein
MSAKPLVLLSCLAACSLTCLAAEKGSGVKITEEADKLRIEINGELFTEYHFKGDPHVYFYPVIGPGGAHMTRDYPMKRDSEGEEHDHPHHRSLWYSHGQVNGVDFWAEDGRAGKILHDSFVEVKSGAKEGIVRSKNNWVAPDGTVVCTDERLFRVYATPANERLVDYDITIKASDKPLVLGDTKEGTMALRLNETMRLKPNKHNSGKPKGTIVLSTGVRDDATWGKRAPWCDYSGPVEGKTLGVTIFDHPKNPRHPTWWHVRDYGLFAANPFGQHDFEKKPAGTGDLTIEPNKSVTFRYRIYVHEGNHEQGKVEERFQQYARE